MHRHTSDGPRTRIRTVRRLIERALGRRTVHLLHLGKTGGTAVKHALSQQALPRSVKLRLHGHEVTLSDIPRGDGFFFIVRDPISRFVSAFYSRQRQGQPRYSSPWSEAERLAFERFSTANELALALSSDEPAVLAQARHAMQHIEHVKDSYWGWFGDEAALRARMDDLLFIGFQESLDADFELLCAVLGLPEGVALPGDDVLAHRSPADRPRELDPAAVACLQRWYAPDFEFVELSRSIARERGFGGVSKG